VPLIRATPHFQPRQVLIRETPPRHIEKVTRTRFIHSRRLRRRATALARARRSMCALCAARAARCRSSGSVISPPTRSIQYSTDAGEAFRAALVRPALSVVRAQDSSAPMRPFSSCVPNPVPLRP
jgi:hypothetical protein